MQPLIEYERRAMANNSSEALPVRAYGWLICAGSYLQCFVLLAIRLTWGWQLAHSGWQHLHDVPTMVQRFQKWGVPLPTLNVYVSGTTELVGGTLLILGLGTRLVSLPLIFNFIVAYLTASRQTLGHLFGGPNHLDAYDDFINDAAFPMLIMSLAMLAFGPGKVSIDYLLKRTVFRKSKPEPTPPGQSLSQAS
jgi:putative oxidoreductase